MSDFQRRNAEVTVFPSAARTASENSPDEINEYGRGVRLHLDITDVAGTLPTLNVKVQAKDPISNVYFDIGGAGFPEKTATGSDDLVIYPGVAETANEAVSDVLPRTWRAVATIGGSSVSFTFSLAASYVL